MKVTRWQVYYKPGTPSSVEGYVYFHIDDAWLDNEWTDATAKWQMFPYNIMTDLIQRISMKTYHEVTMNSDMVYKVIDEFVKADWHCKCVD